MKKYLKRSLWSIAIVSGFALFVYAAMTTDDYLNLVGRGAINNVSVFQIDSTPTLTFSNSDSTDGLTVTGSSGETVIYNGDMKMSGAATTPSTTAGTYPGFMVRINNGSGAAMAQGSVVISSVGATGTGTTSAILSTTTVLGVAEGVIAADGGTGYMTIAGWALVLTTGTVQVGDILVSTDGSNGGGAAGYAGVDNTPTDGATIGIAMSAGTAAGGLTLALIRQ